MEAIMVNKQPLPQARKPKAPVRMPQRSEDVAGDEQEGTTPIAAAQKDAGKPGEAKTAPRKH
jgi:hypothetical protein